MSQAGFCCYYYCFLGKRRNWSIRTSSSFVAIILFLWSKILFRINRFSGTKWPY